ncbi:hypothetical protein F0242_20725 [Vibrio rotiferianus]|nr:hypothetical protein [Vibrio rotiferianus]
MDIVKRQYPYTHHMEAGVLLERKA